MISIPINELNIYNAATKIYCHPDNYQKVLKQVNFIEDKDHIPDYIFRPNLIQIHTNENLKKEEKNGWIRNNQILPDHPFVTFVEEEELEEPKSWQIFFGLVQPKITPIVYIINDFWFKPRYNFKLINVPRDLITNESV